MITREEYKFLKKSKTEGFNWIARDKNWKLFMYQEMPRQSRTIWNFGGGAVNIREEYFTFIKWEDEKPTSIADLINEYEQHETLKRKAVIPQYVADWIEGQRSVSGEMSVFDAYDDLRHDFARIEHGAIEADEHYKELTKKVFRWIHDTGDKFALAWLNGYVVEKEKLYTVQLKNGYHLCKYEGTGVRWLNMTEFTMADCYKLTQSEIESVDPRLMQFAEEVE